MHETVLQSELCSLVTSSDKEDKGERHYFDATLGAGGHSEFFLENTPDNVKLISIDCDLDAIKMAHERLKKFVDSKRLRIVHSNFEDFKYIVRGMNLENKVCGVMADLGVSSMQLDRKERGFSFMRAAPLDMRMDQSNEGVKSASELLETIPLSELVKILFDYGQEPKARPIAKAIFDRRKTAPIKTTTELAALVSKFYKKGTSRKHPATRTFQAIRIAVNRELSQVQELVDQSFASLCPGGKVGIISFHSLEDRIVKRGFQKFCGKKEQHLSSLPIPGVQGAQAKALKPFPLIPDENEISKNPRARSAKLRVIEKL